MAELLLSKGFVSMIKVDGIPIPIPPLILPEDRKNIDEWRKQAAVVEERISLRRQQAFSSSQLKGSRLQSSKIGAIPARSANFEERPQSVSGVQVVRRALTSAASYNDEKANVLAGMLERVALDDGNKDEHESSSQSSPDENGQRLQVASVNSGPPLASASSTDLEPYLSHSSTSTDETDGTVRPESLSTDAYDGQHQQKQLPQQQQQVPASAVTRGSYTIETPSSALLQYNQEGDKDSSSTAKPQFGHLGSMVARYLTEQQRAKNLSEFAKLQSILQENSPGASDHTKQSQEAGSSVENSPSKRTQIEGLTASPSVAGVKRRLKTTENGGEIKLSRISASDRLVAVVRGFLVRRVMQTQKVQHWVQTILDCRRLLTPETSPGGGDWRSLADMRFREQVASQLASGLEEFHAIMFDWSLGDRLALIAKDDVQKSATPRSVVGRALSKARISPAAFTSASRGRSLSASSLQTQHHAHQKQQAVVIMTLRNASGTDVTKRRRLGAVTPPKSAPSNQQSSRVNGRPPPSSRPATSAGTGSRLPVAEPSSRVTSGGVSPHSHRQVSVPANSRPSTAAARIATAADTRANGKKTEIPTAPTHSVSGRRSTISGPAVSTTGR